MKNAQQTKPFLTEKRRNLIFYICFIAFPFLQFLVFYVGVNFNSFLLAFRQYDPVTNVTSWDPVGNFRAVFATFANDPLYATAAKNSAIVYAVRLLIGMPLALLFSFYIYKRFLGYKFFRVVLFLPSVLSAIVMVSIFQNIADRAIPEIVRKMFKVNMQGLLVNPDTKFGMILFYNIWISFGVSVLMYVDSMKSISPEMVEAARLEGVNGLQEFWYITLPSIFPTITTFVVIGLAAFFTDQANIFSFYGRMADTGIVTFGYYLYSETYWATAKGFYEQYNYLAALGIVMTVITVPVTLGVRKLMNTFGPSAQ